MRADISKKNVVIASHELVYGAPQALNEYLINLGTGSVTFVSHPLFIEELNQSSKSFISVLGQTGKKVNKFKNTGFSILDYLIHFILSIWWPIKQNKNKIDLFVGVDPINALAGIFLKKFGYVQRTVFYTIDFTPMRFENRLLNNFYHFLDRYCFINADETWNVSAKINQGRQERKPFPESVFKKQFVVPIGVWFDKVKRTPFKEIKKNQLLFVGNLIEKQGVQLIIKSIPYIIQHINDIHLLVIGGGDYEEELRQIAKNTGVEKHISFLGWVKDRSKLDNLMGDSALAVATYDPSIASFSVYADPTKLKDYLSAGLPIILTCVPHNAYELEDQGCGFVVDYDSKKIAKKVVQILNDEKLLKISRHNAISYIKKYDWSEIFNENINRVFL